VLGRSEVVWENAAQAQGLSEKHNARERENNEEDGRRDRMSFQNHNEMRVSHFR